MTRKIRRLSKNTTYKCAVCGDKPTGYHYDVISCNGCKTFFRRTIVHERKFVCKNNGACQFDKDFRCACRACRFEKCVKAGMKTSEIVYPSDSPSTSSQADIPYKSHKLDELLLRECGVRRLRQCPSPLIPPLSLSQLLAAPSLLITPPSLQEDHPPTGAKAVRFWNGADLRLAIEFAKALPTFTDLDRDDQLALLTHSTLSVMLLSQSMSSLEQGLDSMTFPGGIHALPTIREYFIISGVVPNEMKIDNLYCRPIRRLRQVQPTFEEYTLVKTIMMFSPDSASLSGAGRERISSIRDETCAELLAMLNHTHAKQAPCRYACLLLCAEDMYRFGEKRRSYIEMHTFLSASEPVAPFVKEIYTR